jgi:hypothetical protein
LTTIDDSLGSLWTAFGVAVLVATVRFTYLYDGPDAFDGDCVHEVFATDGLGNPDAADVQIPPADWLTTSPPNQWCTSDAYTVSWTVTLTPVAG